MNIQAAFNQPFDEAIRFFEGKLKLPSASYTDIWREQHSHHFVVAGAMQDALVEDLYNALHKAMSQGTGYQQFLNDFQTIVKDHGWSHNGSAGWRSKVIYDTNIRTAYAAGQWEQAWSIKHLRPYFQYHHHSIINPRIEHVHLDGKIFALDDAITAYIWPPNGWGCQCTVSSLSQFEADAIGSVQTKNDYNIEWVNVDVGKSTSNPRTVKTPKITFKDGKSTTIDPSFAYNPGKAWLEPHTVPKLTGYDKVLAVRTGTAPPVATLPPTPTPTPVKASILLPSNTAPAVAAEDFLNTFGADLEQGVVFEDATGVPVVITNKLFTDEAGTYLIGGKEIESINLLAMALIEPDEVWYRWEQDKPADSALLDDGIPMRWRLKRRYIRLFNINGLAKTTVTAFEWSHKGWTADTIYIGEELDQAVNNLRTGKLVYKKGEK